MNTSPKRTLNAGYQMEWGANDFLELLESLRSDMHTLVALGPSLFSSTQGVRGDLPPQVPLLLESLALWWWGVFSCFHSYPEALAPEKHNPFGVQQILSLWEISRKQCRLFLMFPWTSQISPRRDCTKGAPGVQQAAGRAVIKKHHPECFRSRFMGQWAQRTSHSHKAGRYLLSIKHKLSRWVVQSQQHRLFHYTDIYTSD